MDTGDKVPGFKFQATNEVHGSLAQYKGKWLVLYFYPKDATPGCTNESKDFAKNYEAFQDLGCEVFGVSRDSLHSHDKFKAKLELPFELISDENEELCQLFNVLKLKKMYGKEHIGIERSSFIIDPEGLLRKSWRKVKVDGHVDEVLQSLKALQ